MTCPPERQGTFWDGTGPSHALGPFQSVTLNSMKVDLYIAASLEGFIADEHGSTSWACDEALFEKTVRDYGCICMGHTTYTEYGGPPFDGVQHIVLARRLPKKATPKGVHFATSVHGAMERARTLGFTKMLVIGGAKTNQSFMQADVVQRIYTDIHPILLGRGLQMFGDYQAKFDFTMQKHRWHKDGFMHAEYTIGQTHKGIAMVIIRDQQGRYFAHRRRLDKKYFPGLWGLGAGGKIGDTEDPGAAAIRELREETGLKAAVSWCFKFEYADGTVKHTVHVYETTVRKPRDYKNGREWDKVAWMNAEQINELMADGAFCPDTKEAYQRYRASLSGLAG
jgi:dihydrofolate reductase/8-oxo-dGTP pyrophosphatase MutT (NUDIX family)